MTLILDGKVAATRFLEKIKKEILVLGITPKLAIMMIGNNPASEIYVKNKLLKAKEIGIETQLLKIKASSRLLDILKEIKTLNEDKSVNGIIVQAPLPDNSMQNIIFNSILPEKDVDGFSATNVAKLVKSESGGLISCTPLGIVTLLKEYHIDLPGKHVVVIGRSDIVGRPLSILLSQKSTDHNATVTLCHSATKNLESLTKIADIIVVAAGQKHFLKQNMIKSGVVVIDVGINRECSDVNSDSFKIFGDADFDNIKNICQAITPVPGGVGPMTVATLMSNTFLTAKRQLGFNF